MTAGAWRALAVQHLERGEHAAARAALESIPGAERDATDASNLAWVSLQLDDRPAAREAIEVALGLDPQHIAARSNRAHLLQLDGDEAAAEAVLRDLLPSQEAHVVWSLAGLILQRGAVSEAIALLRSGLAQHPHEPRLWNNLGLAWLEAGEPARAVSAFAEAAAQTSSASAAISNRVMAALYDPLLAPDALPNGYWAHRKSMQRLPLGEPVERMVLVTADAYQHPVGRMLDLLLPALQSLGVEVHLLSDARVQDALSARLASYSCVHRICGQSDASVRSAIRLIEPDTLIDLNGHTARGRPELLAERIAPRQLNWYGLPMGSGARHCDASLVGQDLLVPGGDVYFPEPILPLANAHLMTSPPSAAVVAPPPCLQRGFITFGSFNNIAKLNDRVIDLWCRLLRSVPNSRLILKWRSFADRVLAQSFWAKFVSGGIDPARVECRGASVYEDMLSQYGDIDIALDTWPFSGGMTSMEALWMGVPLVTLAGIRPISRQGVGLLRAIDRSDWVANTEAEYLSIALQLAENAAELKRWRCEQRDRMAQSMICDGVANAAALLTAIVGDSSWPLHR